MRMILKMSVRRPTLAACSLAFAALLCGWTTTVAVSADSILPKSGSANVSIGELARGLESTIFREREAASRQLADSQSTAVPILLGVAKGSDLEAAVRAVGILEAIYIAADEKAEAALDEAVSAFDEMTLFFAMIDSRQAQTTADAAEFALDDLVRSGRPSVADRAEVVLETHYDIRQRRALAEIRSLNGRPIFDTTLDAQRAGLRQGPPPVEQPGNSSKERGELMSVVVGPNWKGGDGGLVHIARLKRLKMIYRIEGSPVTDEGIARLRAALPGLEVLVRGAAKLGIASERLFFGSDKGCSIGKIEPGEAAANAGLRVHDRILRFADHPVENFESLVEILRTHKPGETIEATILRDDTVLRVPITLTGWD